MNVLKKKIVVVSLGLIIFSLGLNAAEQTKSCLDSKKAEEVLKTYKWMSEAGPLNFNSCDSENLFTKTIEALINIESLPVLEARSDEFNKNSYGSSPIQYIKDRVSKFIFDADHSDGCSDNGTIAYVFRGQNMVHICPMASKMSKLDLMEVLIHETRHIDGYGHALCVRGPYKGENAYACDTTYDQRGSYGVGAEFKVRVSRTSSLDPAMRSEARASAVSDFLVRFNQLPLGLKDGVFVQDKNQRLYFANDSLTPLISKTPNGILVSRYGLPTWFDVTSANVRSFDLVNNLVDTGGTFAVDYRKDWSPLKANSLVDVLYGSYSCKIFLRNMECSASSDSVAKFNFFVNAKAFLFLQDTTLLKMEDNTVYVLPNNYEKLLSSKVEQWTKLNKTINYTSLVTYTNTQGYAVGDDGLLRYLTTDAKQQAPVKVNENIQFNKVIGPAIWSNRLNGI